MKKTILLLILASIILASVMWSDNKSNSVQLSDNPKETVSQSVTPISNTQLPSLKKAPMILECASSDKYINDLGSLIQKRNKIAKKLVKSINKSTLPLVDKEKLIQYAGVSLDTFRKISSKYQFNYEELRLVPHKSKRLKGSLRQQFFSSLMMKDYNSIVTLVESGDVTKYHIFGAASILSRILQNDKQIKLSVVEQLIQVGLTPNFADLVAMTRQNASIELIQLLATYNESPLDQTWFHHYRQNTLSMLAAQMLNDTLFDYWLGLGSPLITSEFDYTAIDVMKTPANEQELIQATNIFTRIVSEQVLPYKIDTLDNIKTWLPLDVQQQNEHYFIAHNSATTAVRAQLSERNNEKAQRSADLFANIEQQIANLRTTMDRCRIDESAFETTMAKTGTSTDIAIDKNADNAISKFNVLDKNQQLSVVRLLDFLTTKDWVAYLAEIDKLSNNLQDSNIRSMALIQLINRDAPFIHIKSLLENNTLLSPRTIDVLIRNNNIKLAEKLLPYGLSLSAQYQNRQNEEQFTISEEMKRFLEENVP